MMLLEFSEVKLKTSSAGFGALGLGLESRMRNTSRTFVTEKDLNDWSLKGLILTWICFWNCRRGLQGFDV